MVLAANCSDELRIFPREWVCLKTPFSLFSLLVDFVVTALVMPVSPQISLITLEINLECM